MSTKAKWLLALIVVAVAITMLTPTIFADAGIVRPVVKIYCDGAVTSVSPQKVVAKDWQVEFLLDGSCSTVTVEGGDPIGTITLVNPGDSSRTVYFHAPGTYTYTTDGHDKSPTGPYTIIVPEGVPSLSPLGIGMLIALLLGVTTWVLWRRRAGVTA